MQQQVKDAVAIDWAELRKKIEEIAIRMLKEGQGEVIVSRVTGLPVDQLAILKNKL